MARGEDDLFASVDALLAVVASLGSLPGPAERKRLRELSGLSQSQVAEALGVRRETVGGWESGRSEPRAPQRTAYARLLEGLALRYSSPATVDDDPGSGNRARTDHGQR